MEFFSIESKTYEILFILLTITFTFDDSKAHTRHTQWDSQVKEHKMKIKTKKICSHIQRASCAHTFTLAHNDNERFH